MGTRRLGLDSWFAACCRPVRSPFLTAMLCRHVWEQSPCQVGPSGRDEQWAAKLAPTHGSCCPGWVWVAKRRVRGGSGGFGHLDPLLDWAEAEPSQPVPACSILWLIGIWIEGWLGWAGDLLFLGLQLQLHQLYPHPAESCFLPCICPPWGSASQKGPGWGIQLDRGAGQWGRRGRGRSSACLVPGVWWALLVLTCLTNSHLVPKDELWVPQEMLLLEPACGH